LVPEAADLSDNDFEAVGTYPTNRTLAAIHTATCWRISKTISGWSCWERSRWTCPKMEIRCPTLE